MPKGRLKIKAGQPQLLEIVLTLERRAASRAAWIAGNNKATNMPMMAMTTSSSTRVNAEGLLG